MFVRSAYNYDRESVSRSTALHCPEKGRTQQHQKEEADINTIVKRFGLTGKLPDNVRVPRYGDFTAVTDYQSALNAVKFAEEQFMALPATIRARFANDPQQLIEFIDNEDNYEEAVKLGLAEKKPGVSAHTPAPESNNPKVEAAPAAQGNP